MEMLTIIYMLVTGVILLWAGLLMQRISAVIFGLFGIGTALVTIIGVYNGC